MRAQDRLVSRVLWAIYGSLALGGVVLLADALFFPFKPASTRLPDDVVPLQSDGRQSLEKLATTRMSRRIAPRPAAVQAPVQAAVPLESVLRLTGILDFENASPSVAVIELSGESKAYRPGDRVGETGAIVLKIADGVLLEYQRKRFRLTFKGLKEVPSDALGSKDLPGTRED
jgi:type II secretory pathway component PulC